MDERTNQLIHTAMGAGFAEAFMDDVGDDTLEHYGRKGMKWYENIFGEKDDRAAYANGGKGKNKTDDTRKPEKTGKVGMLWEHKVGKPGDVTVNVTVKQGGSKSSSGKRTLSDEQKRKMAEGKARAKERKAQKEQWAKDPAQMLKHKDSFSSDEIKKAMERFRVEDDLARIAGGRSPKDQKQGKSKVDKVIDGVNKVANGVGAVRNVAKNTVDFYNTAADIYNALNKGEKPWPKIKEPKSVDKTAEAIKKETLRKAKAQADMEEDKLRKWRNENGIAGTYHLDYD